MSRHNYQNIYGLVEDATAVSGAAGVGVQLGTNILNDKVRRIYHMLIADVGGAGGVLIVWQGDAANHIRTRKMTVIIPAGATVELGIDITEPLVTARPTTSVLPAAVQNNQIWAADAGAGGMFQVTASQYDMRG